MKMKRWMTLALSGVLVAGTLGYGSAPAKADEAYSTDYVITIPATLDVANKGWNGTDGITAKLGSGTAFDTGKKLTVTAASTNNWVLKSGENAVGYNLATAGDDNSAYNAQAEVPSWEFAADEITTAGKNKGMGIIVEDYSTKPAGTYQDTVTFTAKVESAVPTLATAFENGAVIVINFKYQGSAASATLTNDNGTFKYTAGSGYLWDYQHALNYQDLVIARNEDGKLVVRAADQLTQGYNGNDKNYDMMLKMVFDPATNIYEQSVSRASWDTYMTDAQWFNEYAFTSITINGTDFTSTLTKGSQIVVVN